MAVAVAVDDIQHAEVLVREHSAIASNQRDSIVASPVNEEGIRAFLDGENWPLGLIQTYVENANKVATAAQADRQFIGPASIFGSGACE